LGKIEYVLPGKQTAISTQYEEYDELDYTDDEESREYEQGQNSYGLK
jgi:hypothetical protein